MSQIVLGTANFGNVYGIANGGTLLTIEDSLEIVNWAQQNGINHFDTAIAYGSAENILGDQIDKSLNPEIDAKLDDKSCQSSTQIVEKTKEILLRLGIKQLSVLYLHNEALLGTAIGLEVKRGLEQVLDLGLCKRIGVSVYSEDSILACKKIVPKLSAFQVPENVCDRRLFGSQKVKDFSSNGDSFYVRSIFLQGLLLMNPKSIPRQLSRAVSDIELFADFAEKHSLSRMELCLAYAKSIPWANGIVLGIASLEQLQEIMGCYSALPSGWDTLIPRLPQEILDPRKWNL